MKKTYCAWLLMAAGMVLASAASADENLFGYVKGAEPLPKGALEFYQEFTQRSGKSFGHYEALDAQTELEYGFTDRLAGSIALTALGVDTQGILIDAYIPKDEKYGLRFSGFEAALKYSMLTPAKDDLGLALYFALVHHTLDPHSGQDKDTLSLEQKLLLQKYYLDGQVVLAGNLGLEATRAKRAPIDNLPPGFEWPTTAEMEIEFSTALGLTYRFAPNWFIGAEMLYQREHETEVDLERWSLQAGPTLHYGAAKWWATLTWLPQLKGGGEEFPEQTKKDLHLIEKTEREVRLKIGYNF